MVISMLTLACFLKYTCVSVYFCFVDLLSLVLSKKDMDMSRLTEMVMVGYSTVFESMVLVFIRV